MPAARSCRVPLVALATNTQAGSRTGGRSHHRHPRLERLRPPPTPSREPTPHGHRHHPPPTFSSSRAARASRDSRRPAPPTGRHPRAARPARTGAGHGHRAQPDRGQRGQAPARATNSSTGRWWRRGWDTKSPRSPRSSRFIWSFIVREAWHRPAKPAPCGQPEPGSGRPTSPSSPAPLPRRQATQGTNRAVGPDLAVEVLSKSNTKAEIALKLREYLGSGTRLAWIVDPKTRSVVVHTSPDESTRLDLVSKAVLDGGDVLPGFRLALADLFAASEK